MVMLVIAIVFVGFTTTLAGWAAGLVITDRRLRLAVVLALFMLATALLYAEQIFRDQHGYWLAVVGRLAALLCAGVASHVVVRQRADGFAASFYLGMATLLALAMLEFLRFAATF